jgi:tetratricopeptide (TPR) repeat protein
MKQFLIAIAFVFFACNVLAQKQTFDSLARRFSSEKIDSNRVKLLWLMSRVSNMYNPDTSLKLAQQALYLAQKIKYPEGESRSLGVLAVAFRQIGNYQKALEFFLKKLQIDEKRDNPRNLASSLINIGILYVNLEQYRDAMSYYKRADTVVSTNNITELEYYINNNLGDVYERLNINDSAFVYFSKSLVIATNKHDGDLMGTSMIGFGHIYLKQANYNLASQYYRDALTYLEKANDEDLICEATLGLAKLYSQLHNADSAEYYALRSYVIAKKDGFESRQLDAAAFLKEHFKTEKNTSQALAFSEITQTIKDSINSKENVRALQIISSNEQLRQYENEENKKKAIEERHKQLQLLLIGLFIPILFLITLVLSRRKIHARVIKFLGVLSLLMLFEYLLLLLHPRVLEFTHHTPVYEMMIFVAIASILVPAHHRLEHWVITRLINRKTKVVEVEQHDEQQKLEA